METHPNYFLEITIDDPDKLQQSGYFATESTEAGLSVNLELRSAGKLIRELSLLFRIDDTAESWAEYLRRYRMAQALALFMNTGGDLKLLVDDLNVMVNAMPTLKWPAGYELVHSYVSMYDAEYVYANAEQDKAYRFSQDGLSILSVSDALAQMEHS